MRLTISRKPNGSWWGVTEDGEEVCLVSAAAASMFKLDTWKKVTDHVRPRITRFAHATFIPGDVPLQYVSEEGA